MHNGHRNRLRNRFLNSGGSGLEKHELLELYLTYAIPRKNTNDIAHRLMNCFVSLERIFEADKDGLLKVNGIGEKTALLINLLNPVSDILEEERSKSMEKITTIEDLYNYIKKNIDDIDEGSVFILQLSPKLEILSRDKLGNSDDFYAMSMKNLLKKIIRSDTKYIVFVKKSGKDDEKDDLYIKGSSYIKNLLSILKIEVVDCIIFNGECKSLINKVLSVKDNI